MASLQYFERCIRICAENLRRLREGEEVWNQVDVVHAIAAVSVELLFMSHHWEKRAAYRPVLR